MVQREATLIAGLLLVGCAPSVPTSTSTSTSTATPTPTATSDDPGSASSHRRPADGPSPSAGVRPTTSTATPTSTATATSTPTPTACNGKCTGTVTAPLAEALTDAARKSRRCYEQELAKNPQLSGKLTVEVKLDASGGVCSVELASTDTALKQVAACTKKTFEDTKDLPAPQGGCVIARIPVVYVPQPRDGGRD